MAAPIQRYSDPRLEGSCRTTPFFHALYQFKSAFSPIHPQSDLQKEVAKRTELAAHSAIKMCSEAFPAAMGRMEQIVHYHSLSEEERASPPAIDVDGLRLPTLKPTSLPPREVFCGTKEEKAKEILRGGFDTTKTCKKALFGNGVYLTPLEETAGFYGKNRLVVSLDLKKEEIAYLDPTAFATFQLEHRKLLAKENGYLSLSELLLRNGYRCVEYDLYDWKRGAKIQRALVIFDPTCVSVKGIRAEKNQS